MTDLGSYDGAAGVAVQHDGKIVAVGDSNSNALPRPAVRDAMPALEPIKFRLSRDVIDMDGEGLSGVGAQDRGEVLAESARMIPDVVGELCRRLPLSRATIVRTLRECKRLDDVTVNPAVFMD